MSIYLSSDWHLITMPQGRKPQLNISRLSAILGELDKLTSKDTFVFMGDMFDDNFEFPINGTDGFLDKIAERISVAEKAIFIRGNNDVFNDIVYKNLGFDDIVWGYVIPSYSMESRILLSHTSVDLEGDPYWVNIHAHIHRNGVNPDEIMYYHNPVRCINLCTKEQRELTLTKLDDIYIEAELARNNMWSPGSEKPGMSRLCQNMAKEVYYNIFE